MIRQARLRTRRSLDGLKAEIATNDLQPRASHCHPEKDLCAAVLEDGIARAASHQLERDWILSDEEGYLFAFRTLCEVLELDAERVRRKVQAQWSPLPNHSRRSFPYRTRVVG